ncbi:MAG: methyltransferase domain-containing protein [Bacteroidales bacterium]|nr:methyltransferase domain-containing protein [Candidatus Latescibacterota bacterium]
MSEQINNKLLELLACPECGTAFTHSGMESNGLCCPGCHRVYGISGGIPLLIPDDTDMTHIEEEEKLGELMADHIPSGGEIFHEQQWKNSKKEYWDFVRKELKGLRTDRIEPTDTGELTGSRELVVLNVGCGLDTGFLDLVSQKSLSEGSSGRDLMLVAFDLMQSLLESLRDDYQSRFNVAGAVQALPFADNTFDCVCCIDLIHHEPDLLEKMLSSFFRILRPGGILILEDINAWGLFQFWKSILLPRPVHGVLRSLFHRLRGSGHQPASYEFPTSVFRVRKILLDSGFTEVTPVPQAAYPNICPAGYSLFRTLSRLKRIVTYHNFHYMLRAIK